MYNTNLLQSATTVRIFSPFILSSHHHVMCLFQRELAFYYCLSSSRHSPKEPVLRVIMNKPSLRDKKISIVVVRRESKDSPLIRKYVTKRHFFTSVFVRFDANRMKILQPSSTRTVHLRHTDVRTLLLVPSLLAVSGIGVLLYSRELCPPRSNEARSKRLENKNNSRCVSKQ